MAAPTPTLSHADRGAISRKALLALGLPTALLCAVSMPFADSHPLLIRGILLGHFLAQLMTGIWVGGALATMDRSATAFMGATLGLAPVRFVIVLGGVYVCTLYLAVAMAPLALSLVFTMVYGHVIEVLTFNALAKAMESKDLAPRN